MKSKKTNVIHCRDAARHICENLDEQIDSPLCREIAKHLQTCPDCAAHLRSLKKTVTLYRRCPAPALSSLCHEELMAKLSVIKKKQI